MEPLADNPSADHPLTNHAQQVYAEQVALLYRNAPIGFAVTVVAGGLLAFALYGQTPTSALVAWAACLVLVTSLRFVLWRVHDPSPQDARYWERWFLVGTGLIGFTWGSTMVFLFSPDAITQQVLIVLVLAGMVGGSVAVFSARIPAFLAFALPILLIAAGRFFVEGGRTQTILGILTLLYLGGMLLTARNTERAIRTSLALRFDKGELVAQIAERRLAEDALRMSEKRFKDFAEAAADWFWEIDSDLRLTHVSDRFQEIVGISPSDAMGSNLRQLFGARSDGNTADLWGAHAKTLDNKRTFDDFEFRWTDPNGGDRFLRISGKPLFDHAGTFLGYRGVGSDVTRERRLAQRMAHQAEHDSLTGLVNRRELMRRLDNALQHSQEEGTPYVLCYLDLDQFKVVNDTAGHVAGDELLKQLAAVLTSRIRARDTLARLGGDEFSLLLENCSLDRGVEIAKMLLATLSEFRFEWEDQSFEIAASIGVVPITPNSENVVQILTQADLACYTAKDLGRNRVYAYRPEDSELARRQAAIARVTQLRDALNNNRFCLYSQPIRRLADDSSAQHYELLLRLLEPLGKVVSPASFVAAAEHYGIMADIDRWVIDKAFSSYRPIFGDDASVTISINVSGASLAGDTLFDFIQERLANCDFAPQSVCFEITENAAIRNYENAARFISELKQLGCRFALDDFGRGLSSFSYLKHLPVDYLKIDGSFILDITKDPTSYAMVAAIHEVGHVMGIETVAEWVESEVVIDPLRDIGIEYGQGYALGRPIPLTQCTALDVGCTSLA